MYRWNRRPASSILAMVALSSAIAAASAPAAAQDLPTEDAVVRAIWTDGMDSSRVYPLTQTLLDSIGPRLTGSPGLDHAHDWLVQLYQGWGIEASSERYGTWKGWRRGITHVDLVEPRVRTLDATLLAWSRGTDGPVEAGVVTIPDADQDLNAWYEEAAGKWVLLSPPEPSCRPLDQWEEFADEDTYAAFVAQRELTLEGWQARAQRLGGRESVVMARLADAGVAGVLASSWSGGYGARRVFGDRGSSLPTVSLSCEDFGLLHRLAEHGQGPVVRVDARAEELGEVPVYNTVATIEGTERPDEYVLLSAHLDSWDGAQGATDNGTGTVVMAEAMRLLKKHYPNPRRTIVVGHWGSEEQGLNGSRAFAADHPQIVDGLQAVFNQDNGTGKIARVGMQGLLDAGAHFARWLSGIPSELTDELEIEFPGTPGGGGSDYAAFTCAGAPSFGLWSDSWDYGRYTWHTNLDTLDKLAFDNIRHNAVLVALLAYQASEDPERVGRERRTVLPPDSRTGEPGSWPTCRPPDRSWDGFAW